MEIRRYIPEVTAVGIAEAVATVATANYAMDGDPRNVKELITLYGFATFYAGIPVAIGINVAKNLYLSFKSHEDAVNTPQE